MVTVVVQELVFPLVSIMVSVTWCGPKSSQLKSVRSILIEAISQKALDPPSTCEGVRVALPSASRGKLKGALHTAFGVVVF